jgi:hypothetical protein
MQRRAVVTLASLAVCAGLGIAVACSDDGLAPSQRQAVSAARSRFSRVPGARPVTPAEFDRRNPMHWVGVLHNRGVDLARARLRAHELHVRDICKELPGLLAKDFATQPGAPKEEVIAQHTRSYLATLPSCHNAALSPTVSLTANGQLARPASAVAVRLPLADEDVADALMAAIGTAAYAETDAESFAPVLDSLTSLSDGLDTLSRSAVYGTAAVAMSSAEYWDENLVSFTNEVERDYCDTEVPDPNSGPCLEVPYSLVAPMALSAMMQTNWGNVGKVVGADLTLLATGGLAGLFLFAWAWPAILAAAASASIVTGIVIIIKWFIERM